MRRILTYNVGRYAHAPAAQPLTTEQFLKSLGYSSSLIRTLKQTEEGLILDGQKIYTTHILSPEDTLVVTLPDERPSEHIHPIPMEHSILYEDRDILIIDKKAGVPIHPSQGNHDNTLAGGVAFYLEQKGEAGAFHAINRLDKDTTGLLILAKHALSACILNEMARRREIHRQYVAIALGLVDECGIIDAPVAREDGSAIKRCVDFERGESAVTHYRRLAYDPDLDCSFVALKLETGRTHQIRVHMSYIGHPLPGDFLYCPDYRFIGRQALHSRRLDFLHPLWNHEESGDAMTDSGAGKRMLHFEAPLPPDMRFPGFTSIEGLWDNDF